MAREPRLPQAMRQKPQDTWRYVGLMGDIGYTIALPIAGGAIAGAYADRHLGLFPKITLLGLTIGILVSVHGVIRVLKDIGKG